MKISTITLGCKVNQYETEAMLSSLLESGFTQVEKGESADVVLINSCTVTATSDQKVLKTVRRARRTNPDAVVVLTGCMPQAFPEECESITEADIILGNSNRSELLSHILDFIEKHERIVDIVPHKNKDGFEKLSIKNFHGHTRAFVKIEDGCNRFCSYCIIPYARGRVRSKSLEDLREELTALAANGFREVVLTGINLSCYGQDIGSSMCEAVELACSVEGIDRVRLGSLEPELLELPVIKRLAKQKKLCPQFHLSLQSGCDATLKRMNRHYLTEEYREIVNNLRNTFDNCAITTDIMVGFAGETEEEFAESLAFAEEISFAKVHVFEYSRRPGTRAYEMGDQVSPQDKNLRSHKMIHLTDETRKTFLEAQVGTEQTVLIEREIAEGIYEGHTMNYTRVTVPSDKDICNTIPPVRITEALDDFCRGVII